MQGGKEKGKKKIRERGGVSLRKREREREEETLEGVLRGGRHGMEVDKRGE